MVIAGFETSDSNGQTRWLRKTFLIIDIQQ